MSVLFVSHVLISLLFWVSVLGIIYTYLGYPIIIFLFAKLKANPRPYKENHQPVTLMIAAYNEERVIEEKIQNSLQFITPGTHMQILVVTDGSTDRTPEIVNSYSGSGIELLHQPQRQGKMAAINRAMPFARGEVVIFSDANNFYEPETIKHLTAPFSDPIIGGTSGAKYIKSGDGALGTSEGFYWKYESFIKKQESRLGNCTSASGEIMAIRRKLYFPPPNRIINDDFFIAMQIIRQGFRFVYVPEAVSIERVSPTARDEIVRRTRINAGRYQSMTMAGKLLPPSQPLIAWQVFSHKFLRPLVPFFMIGALLSNIAAVIFPPPAQYLVLLGPPCSGFLLSIQFAFYLTALMGTLLSNPLKQSKLANLLYIPAFLMNSNLAALSGFLKFVHGEYSPIWEKVQRQ